MNVEENDSDRISDTVYQSHGLDNDCTTVKNEMMQKQNDKFDSDHFESSQNAIAKTLPENRNSRTRCRTVSKQSTGSNKSVSIEMDNDSICITTEDLVDEVLEDDNNTCLTENHVNTSSCSNNSQHCSPLNVDIISSTSSSTRSVPSHPQSLNLSYTNATTSPDPLDQNYLCAPDIAVTRIRSHSGSSTTTSGPDSEPPSPYSSSPEQSSGPWDAVGEPLESPSSPESFSQNLQFPENSVGSKSRSQEKKTAKEQVCGVFSVDLGSAKLFNYFRVF